MLVAMLTLGRQEIFVMHSTCVVFFLLASLVDSSQQLPKTVRGQMSTQLNFQKYLQLSPDLSFQITLHAFLLWASFGFLMPIGILIIRISNKVECGRTLKVLFYSHVILQAIAVLLVTAGAVLSMVHFENSFSNTHQRIGLALYALTWIQPLIGFLRPHRGVKVRSIWYFGHWLLGTGITIAGIINIYIGLHVYHEKTSVSVRLWTSLFTAEISIIAFIYLLQDRWDYLQKQGVTLGDEQITPTDQLTSPINQKELAPMP